MRRKVKKKTGFMGIQAGFQSFPYHMKNLLGDFMQNWRERVSSK
jgi:hypothetical protein